MMKVSDLNYDNVPGIKGALKILAKSLIRKFYLKPTIRIKSLIGRNLDAYFNRVYIGVVYRVKWAKFMRRRVIFICGTPTHGNIGDRAISLAETSFLKSSFKGFKVIQVPSQVYFKTGRMLPDELLDCGDIIVLHGGGNMGNVYVIEEELRRSFISKYVNNKIIVFPQTINFSKNFSNYKEELAETKKVYASHRDLTVIAREEVSYKIMKEYFPDNKVILTPDIVLSHRPRRAILRPRYDVVTLMRTDFEKTLSDDDQKNLLDYIDDKFGADKVLHTDMQFNNKPTQKENYNIETMSDRQLVSYKLRQVGSSKIVVTDRLHGMIFAAIMGRACIVFSNHDWKIKGIFDRWILPMGGPIYYCETIDQAKSIIDNISSDGLTGALYEPDVFKDEWDLLKNAIVSTGGGRQLSVSVLMLVYNAPFYTLRSILGVKLKTAKSNFKYELVVLDNLSRSGTRIMLRVLKAIGLIDVLCLNTRNDMFAGGNNIASTLANKDATHYLLLNSDIRVNNKYWLQNIINNHTRGVTAYGVCDGPLRVDGYCYLIDSDIYRKYPLDESHQWWWGITKQQASVMQKYTVLGFDNHDKYLYHYGGKSGNLESIAQAKGMDVDSGEIYGWFRGKRPSVVELI